MNRDKLEEALNEIGDRHISEAANAKKGHPMKEKVPTPAHIKKRRRLWLGAVAAAAAIAIIIAAFSGPMIIDAKAVSLAPDPRITDRPDLDDYQGRDAWHADLDAWEAARDARITNTKTALGQLKDFFTDSSEIFMSGTKNRLWSPANAYIGLAMLAEVTDGNSRQQILDLFGAGSIETLRTQVSAIWESSYNKDERGTSVLASSLWLEDGVNYNQEAMDALAYHYYASIYQGDLGSEKINKAIGAWLNNNTGGLLREYANQTQLPEDTIVALYSTLYFESQWQDQFQSSNNTKEVFHAPSGDKTVTYMNRKEASMMYYWGDSYSAVAVPLKNSSYMWFILPDEGKSIDTVLADGQYMDMILPGSWENNKYMKVNLTVPKFDISGKQDLIPGLQELGITDVFDLSKANFTAITSVVPLYTQAVNQAVRVQIDEEGVKAAAYTEILNGTGSMPPEEIIDFVLDRPFLFVITRNDIPLFAGAVNEP